MLRIRHIIAARRHQVLLAAVLLLAALAPGSAGRAAAETVGLVEIGGKVYSTVAVDDLIEQFGCRAADAASCRDRRGFDGTEVVTAGLFRHDWTVEEQGGRRIVLVTSPDIVGTTYADWAGGGARALPVAADDLPDLFSRAGAFDCTVRGGRYCEIVVYGTVRAHADGTNGSYLAPEGYRITRARTLAGLWWSGVRDVSRILLVLSRLADGVLLN